MFRYTSSVNGSTLTIGLFFPLVAPDRVPSCPTAPAPRELPLKLNKLPFPSELAKNSEMVGTPNRSRNCSQISGRRPLP